MLLAARRAELTEMLQAFTGRQGGGVKLSVEPPAGAAGEGSAARSASGRDRLPRQEWRWVTAEAWAEKIGQALSAIAVATRRHPAPDPLPGAQGGWMALNGVYLLSAERAAGVAEIRLPLTAEPDALRADLTGPGPPHSFPARTRTSAPN